MIRTFTLPAALVAASLVAGAQTPSRTQSRQSSGPAADAPQRTIFTTPAAVHTDAPAPPAPAAPDASDTALEKYREMWRKMTPAQQKAFVDSGGYTPEQYERLLKKGPAEPAGAAPQRAIDPTIDSLNKSLQNLDTIRDANLGRVQGQNCPPEVAARISDLRARLQNAESGRSAAPAPAAAPARRENSTAPDALAIATDWFKPASPPAPATRAGEQGKLLAAVLPGAEASSPKRQIDEQEISRIQTELDQLSGACAAPVR